MAIYQLDPRFTLRFRCGEEGLPGKCIMIVQNARHELLPTGSDDGDCGRVFVSRDGKVFLEMRVTSVKTDEAGLRIGVSLAASRIMVVRSGPVLDYEGESYGHDQLSSKEVEIEFLPLATVV